MKLADDKRKELFTRTVGVLTDLECIENSLQATADIFRNPMNITEYDYKNFVESLNRAKTTIALVCNNAIAELDNISVELYEEVTAENNDIRE